MAESASGQDAANPVFWLATWMGKRGPPILSAQDFPHWSLKKKFSFWPYDKSFIDQACLAKMAVCDLVRFCSFIDLNFVSVHKNA